MPRHPQKFPDMRDVVPSGMTDIEISDEDDTTFDLSALFTITEELDKARHVDMALRTLHSVMLDGNAKGADRVSAAKLTLEACGKIGKGTTNNTFVRAENAQINQTEINDADAGKIKDALSGMSKLLTASDAGIKTHSGGQGV